MKKFWDFIRNDADERVLHLEGPIDEDDFWGDAVTPQMFREELEAEDGDLIVWINSPGGSVFAAASIYTMLRDHKGKITVRIDAIAASAASVVAMAGDLVQMSPVAMLMIHDPMTIAMGNAKDMEKAISTLNEVKASIINAYHDKTGLSRNKISQLMENETWMNAKKAVELGFADEILFSGEEQAKGDEGKEGDDHAKDVKAVQEGWQPYSTRIMGETILNRWIDSTSAVPTVTDEKSDDTENPGENLEPTPAGMTDDAGKAPAEQPDIESDEAMAAVPEPTVTDPKSGENPANEAPETPENGAETGQESSPSPAETGEDEGNTARMNAPVSDEAVAPDETEQIVIGMDGRTKDGAMPYDLLMKQLEFLK